MINKISLFITNLTIGGAERVAVNLSKGLTKFGYDVEIVLVNNEGEFLSEIPESVNLVELDADRLRSAVIPLYRYIHTKNPDVIISFMTGPNIIAILSNILSMKKSRVIATEHNTQTMKSGLSMKMDMYLGRGLYKLSDGIIGVSVGVAENVSNWANIPKKEIEVIHNPVIEKNLLEREFSTPPHEWYNEKDIPTIVSAGRHVEQKNFQTLIRAFDKVLSEREARLVLIGEGEKTEEYEDLVKDLGIQDHVCMPGFVDNLYEYLFYSDVFVLSSAWEGLSMVLIEAMACRTPVVSTDCPYGPAEVLRNGIYGSLVPVDSYEELGNEILETLENPSKEEQLTNRASDFSIEAITQEYVDYIKSDEN